MCEYLDNRIYRDTEIRYDWGMVVTGLGTEGERMAADRLALVEAHSPLFGSMNRVEEVTRDMILSIPDLTDEQLAQMREYAGGFEQQAWRIVCACDAEAMKRDVATGAKAAYLAGYADATGASPVGVYQNAQLHRTFFEDGEIIGANNFPVLPKEFYRIAMTVADPQAALALFIDKKAANPAYSTRDAQRDARAMKERDRFAGKREAVAHLSTLGQFPIIYADPPWQYSRGTTTPDRDIERHYPTMTLDEVMALPVATHAQDDALLLLWATNPLLPEALTVLDAWGFSYRSNIVWVKDRLGLGHWVRGQHELLLLGRRGNFPPPDDAVQPASVLSAPRTEHSAKPFQVYDIIERMYPGLPKLELFARQRRGGDWTSWGNEMGTEVTE